MFLYSKKIFLSLHCNRYLKERLQKYQQQTSWRKSKGNKYVCNRPLPFPSKKVYRFFSMIVALYKKKSFYLSTVTGGNQRVKICLIDVYGDGSYVNRKSFSVCILITSFLPIYNSFFSNRPNLTVIKLLSTIFVLVLGKNKTANQNTVFNV